MTLLTTVLGKINATYSRKHSWFYAWFVWRTWKSERSGLISHTNLSIRLIYGSTLSILNQVFLWVSYPQMMSNTSTTTNWLCKHLLLLQQHASKHGISCKQTISLIKDSFFYDDRYFTCVQCSKLHRFSIFLNALEFIGGSFCRWLHFVRNQWKTKITNVLVWRIRRAVKWSRFEIGWVFPWLFIKFNICKQSWNDLKTQNLNDINLFFTQLWSNTIWSTLLLKQQ